jgi:hypothetical protein
VSIRASVSPECRRLAQQVPLPATDRDAKITLARYRAALERANQNLGATSECIGVLVEAYANYGR